MSCQREINEVKCYGGEICLLLRKRLIIQTDIFNRIVNNLSWYC